MDIGACAVAKKPFRTRGVLFKFGYLWALLGIVAVALLIAYLRSL
jgi:hypothetical protein